MNKEWQLYDNTTKLINLRGVFVANAIVEYKFDPSTFTIDMLYQYSIIPQSLYNQYMEKKCHIKWEYLWLVSA
jgi:hypothetical protein